MALGQISQGADVLLHRFFRQGIAAARLPFKPVLVPDYDGISPYVHDPLFLKVNQPFFHNRGINPHLESEEVTRERKRLDSRSLPVGFEPTGQTLRRRM